jgi:sulfur carrier protein
MIVVLNGQEKEVPSGMTVAGAVALAGVENPKGGVAVAVGGEVVPRAEWEGRVLADGETVEVVRAVQGG